MPPSVLIAFSSPTRAFSLDAGLSRLLQPGDARLGSFLVPGNGVLAFFDGGAGGVLSIERRQRRDRPQPSCGTGRLAVAGRLPDGLPRDGGEAERRGDLELRVGVEIRASPGAMGHGRLQPPVLHAPRKRCPTVTSGNDS